MTSMISNGMDAQGRVILWGATGRLGEMLRLCWPHADDLLPLARRAGRGVVVADLADPETVSRYAGARAVIDLTGVTPACAARTGANLDDNTALAQAAVRFARQIAAPRVFVPSTAAVYGRAQGVQTEDTLCQPIAPYGHAKLAMEQATAAPGVTALRIANVAGADAIVGGWQTGMALDVFADGTTPARSYIGPHMFAQTLYDLTCAEDLPPVLNVAAGIVRFADLLDAADLAWQPRTAPDSAIASVVLSTDRLASCISDQVTDQDAAALIADWRGYLDKKDALT